MGWMRKFVAGLAVLASAGAAQGAEGTVTWTSREDFEGSAAGAAAPTVNEGLDTATRPGEVALASLVSVRAEGKEQRLPAELVTSAPPAVAANPAAHEYLVVWRQNGKSIDLQGQRLDRAGAALGKSVSISANPAVQHQPRVVWAGAPGQYLVVWEDSRDGDFGVYARRLSAAAAPQGPEFAVSRSPVAQHLPDVAWSEAAGEYLVAWQATPARGREIRARRVSAAGVPAGAEILVCDDGVDQDLPRVAALPGGGYLVLWTDRRAGNADILGRLVARDGSLPSPAFPVRTAPHDEMLTGLEAAGGSDGFLALWDDYRAVALPELRGGIFTQLTRIPRRDTTPGTDVFAQRLDGAGVPLGPELQITARVRNQLQADAAWLPAAGAYLAVWQDGRDGYEDWDAYGRLVGASGSLSGEFAVTTADEEQFAPRVACDAAGECLAAWWHLRGPNPRESGISFLRFAVSRGSSGTLSGLVADAGRDGARWRSLSWSAQTPAGSAVRFRTRSAPTREALPQREWSDGPDSPGEAPTSPPGRWLEIEVRLESADGTAAPVVEEISASLEGD